MLKVIVREGIFETNSSSCHSFSLAYPLKGRFWNLRKLPVDSSGGVYQVEPNEFGWDYESYSDAATKISYAATQYQDSPDLLEHLEKVIKEVHPYITKVDFSKVSEGYIDHQSVDPAFIPQDALKAWLFDGAATLVIDNDNY